MTRGKFHGITDAVRAKKEETVLTRYLPSDCTFESFASSGIILLSTGMTPASYKALMNVIPEHLRQLIIGYKRVQQLPGTRKAA